MKMRLFALALGGFVFALDALTKVWVKNSVWLHDRPVIDGLLTIQYATNEGIAFGFFHDLNSAWKTPVLAAMAVLAIAMVLYYVWTTPPGDRLVFVSLGLLLGGIAGNFVDRLLHQSVVDFIKLHWGNQFAWPTFNVADSAITCGVALILLASFWGAPGESETRPEKDSVAVK